MTSDDDDSKLWDDAYKSQEWLQIFQELASSLGLLFLKGNKPPLNILQLKEVQEALHVLRNDLDTLIAENQREIEEWHRRFRNASLEFEGLNARDHNASESD
jgi:hypothetical protein